MPEIPIYTIGYGARDMEDFLAVLRANQIDYLIDVRSRPYSRYKPDFSKDALNAHLQQAGIRYVFMGDALGGQPDDDDCYTDGKVDYDKVAATVAYQEGVRRITHAFHQQLAVVLMCSEGKPELCHRSKLIGKTLHAAQVPVLHIDENDRLITQDDVALRYKRGQPSLFGDDFHKLTSRNRYRGQDED